MSVIVDKLLCHILVSFGKWGTLISMKGQTQKIYCCHYSTGINPKKLKSTLSLELFCFLRIGDNFYVQILRIHGEFVFPTADYKPLSLIDSHCTFFKLRVSSQFFSLASKCITVFFRSVFCRQLWHSNEYHILKNDDRSSVSNSHEDGLSWQ